VRILRAADTRVMPWKNSGGSTREVMIWPPGASLETGFDWRVSMADVATSGPFSRFPGYDRLLMVIEGAGITLTGLPDGPRQLMGFAAEAGFAGEQDVAGELINGPVRDFNLITRRSTATGKLTVFRSSVPSRLSTAQGFAVATVLHGGLRVIGQSLAPGDSLLLEPQESAMLVPEPGGDVLLALAEIGPAGS
jgi:uncharacterized protein